MVSIAHNVAHFRWTDLIFTELQEQINILGILKGMVILYNVFVVQ